MRVLDAVEVAIDRKNASMHDRCMFHPHSFLMERYNEVKLLLVLYLAFSLPFSLGFSTGVLPDSLSLFDDIFSLTIDAVFMLDILIIFRTGVPSTYKIDTIDYSWKLAGMKYLTSWFIVDLVSATPTSLIRYLLDTTNPLWNSLG